jgi:serine/threonine-protein kinase
MKRDGETMEPSIANVAIEPARATEPHLAVQARPDSTMIALPAERDTAARVIGRYVLFREVAHGGMATVHLGRLRSVGGFARTVAIKRLLPPFARDPEFVSMFLDEARLAARIQHPNVVSVLDVVASDGELFLVMEYVHGEGLSKLLKRARAGGIPVPQGIAVHILIDVLYGLHAAHEARNERGDRLDIVHRDVSPQNVLVGVDGVARVLDFGIAKAAQCAHSPTGVGQLKGKLGYMAPEQVASGVVDRRADVYAAGVTLWEALTGHRMFAARELPKLIAEILTREHVPPSRIAPGSSPELDAVVLCALERDPKHRYATAGNMAADLERIVRLPSRREIGEWVALVADGALQARAASISEIENTTFAEVPSRPPPAEQKPTANVGRPEVEPIASVGGPELEPTASTVGGDSAPRARARATSRAWLGGSAAVVAAIVLGLLGRRGAQGSLPHEPAASVAATVSAPAPVLPAPVAPVVSASSAAPITSSSPDTAATTAARPTSPAPSTRPWWWNSAPPPRSAPPGRSPADCATPYTVDANGVRIPKRWCP